MKETEYRARCENCGFTGLWTVDEDKARGDTWSHEEHTPQTHETYLEERTLVSH